MRPLRYTINVTLDGCVDHRAGIADAEVHRYHQESLDRADALLFGRVTYEMMLVWRLPGVLTAMPEWTHPFARTIDAAKKYVVSRTLKTVDWNSELVQGDLGAGVRKLKEQPGKNIFIDGSSQLVHELLEHELIDELHLLLYPLVLGGGKRLLPQGVYSKFRLLGARPYPTGVVGLHYAKGGSA